jgi:lipid-binding SYLF domain-containing protein
MISEPGNKTTAARAVMTMLFIILVLGSFALPSAVAETAREIDVSVDVALERFTKQVSGGQAFLKAAKGVLVFPNVYKAGLVVGAEYGEGALRIDGKTVDYYSTIAGSFGIQAGAQKKTVIILFMEEMALETFRASSGWEAGVDGSVAVISEGVGGSLDTTNIQDPIVGFVFGQKGLMVNLTLEGSKFNKLDKSKE